MIVELRQYTLHPGQRDVLAGIFHEHLVDSQRAVGMDVIATGYDLDDPDRFVWLRGYPDMVARKAGLTAFYGHSEAWRTHGPAANATMIDSSGVLLLHPLTPLGELPGGDFVVNVYDRGHPVGDKGIWLETEHSANDFPRLPVRTDDVVVSITQAADPSAMQTVRVKRIL